jgi:uncharacterized membrane protein YidH (DUF202 family)
VIDVVRGAPFDRGLQAERTALAWTRTSLAILANGVLLLVKDFPESGGPVRMSVAGLAAAIALAAYLVGGRRQRILCRRPLPQRITPRREVHLVGVLVLVFVVVVALTLIV